MGESIEHLESDASTFRHAIGVVYQAIWSEATLNANPRAAGTNVSVALAWQSLYPEHIMEGCSARAAKAHRVYRRPERRWALYGPLSKLKALAAEHGVSKHQPRRWLVRDLQEVRVPRAGRGDRPMTSSEVSDGHLWVCVLGVNHAK
jgi:hypothetical protein